MAAKPKIDYERIEAEWRAGIKSPRQLAAEYTEKTGVSVSHAALINHFKRLGVPRDLAAKIKAKADAIVTAAMVTNNVTDSQSVTTKRDAEIIEDGAKIVAGIRLTHRKDIGRYRGLANKLMDELEGLTDNRDLFAELGELLRSPDDKGIDRRNELYQKVIDLPSRTKTLKELSESLKTLVQLERQAFSITDDSLPPSDRSRQTDEELDRAIAAKQAALQGG